MMLLAAAIVFILILAFVAALAGLCMFAFLSFVAGVTLRSSRFEWLSPYLIWIPSLVAAFSVFFTTYSFYALARSWRFPADPLEFLIALVIGGIASAGVGAVLALRGRTRVSRVGANEEVAESL